MFITLHCGGMPFNGQKFGGLSIGGSESAAYYVARELAKQGHKVTLFTNDQDECVFEDVRYVWSGNITKQAPLGENFHYYATRTPTDVMIIQRHPQAFNFQWHSKINLWWLHDLALHRSAAPVESGLTNVDGVLCVSEFHKEQIASVWNIDKNIIHVINNGVDLSLFEGELKDTDGKMVVTSPIDLIDDTGEKVNLLYSSRPERGLEHLLKPDGIMEKLWAIDKKYHLYVCMYNNAPAHIRPFYEFLWQRIQEMPNVTNLGCLTKQELADVMRQCDAMVYPTDFEEVSCITAMECMAAGLPFISSEFAALPETCKDSGSILIPHTDKGQVDVDAFVSVIKTLKEEISTQEEYWRYDELQRRQKYKSTEYEWKYPAERILKIVKNQFEDNRKNPGTVITHLIDMSDIYALEYYLDNHVTIDDITSNRILEAKIAEYEECYEFAFEEEPWDEHYRKYYEHEAAKGVEYGYQGHRKENGRENISDNPRYRTVSDILGSEITEGTFVDYGCAHGHYTIHLAKRYPQIQFIGIDIAASNIDTAREWAKEIGLKNVRFYQGRIGASGEIEGDAAKHVKKNSLSGILAAEVIEHLRDYKKVVDGLCQYLQPDGFFMATTPHGPWEAMGYKQEWPWRAHVHHFERQDLHEAFGHHPMFNVINVSPGAGLGSYIWTFRKPVDVSKDIDYERKLSQLAPRQTVSLCMITYNAESSIRNCLELAVPNVDEVIIAVDPKTDDSTVQVIEKFMVEKWPEKPLQIIDGLDPLKEGFDAARNKSIEGASGDWILWIDSDELVYFTDRFSSLLRHSQYNGYGVAQHHFSIHPAGILRTDFPARIFRNDKGIKFFGRVHEHPEKTMNDGVGHCITIGDVTISHPGYAHESIRRGRFMRNIDLLIRDREELPERALGKVLEIRDLAQMCMQHAEQNGGQITETMLQMARKGTALFEEVIKEGRFRYVVDGLEFYSYLVGLLGEQFEMQFALDTSKFNGGPNVNKGPIITGKFLTEEHAKMVLDLVFKEKVKHYGKYF